MIPNKVEIRTLTTTMIIIITLIVFFKNSKASVSDYPTHHEEMCSWHGISRFKSSTTHWCVTRRERVSK